MAERIFWPGGLYILGLGLVVLLAGCGPAKKSSQEEGTSQPGTAQTVVEGVTGYRAIKQGQQMQKQLRGIEAERNKQLDDVLGN